MHAVPDIGFLNYFRMSSIFETGVPSRECDFPKRSLNYKKYYRWYVCYMILLALLPSVPTVRYQSGGFCSLFFAKALHTSPIAEEPAEGNIKKNALRRLHVRCINGAGA